MSLTQAPGARDLAHCGGFITIAMPLDPAFGFAMVVFFFEDWLHHEYYSYAGNVHGGGRREGASVYRCIRAQGRQQKHSEGRKNTEDTREALRFFGDSSALCTLARSDSFFLVM